VEARPIDGRHAQHVDGIATEALPRDRRKHRRVLGIIAIPAVETVNNVTLGAVDATEKALTGLPGVIGVSGLGPIEQDYSHAVFGTSAHVLDHRDRDLPPPRRAFAPSFWRSKPSR